MEFTARMIAELIDGVIEGDHNAKVNTFAKIEEGRKGAISFLANPKYTQYIYDTDSSIVLVSNDFVAERECKATLIRVADPYSAISLLLSVVDKYVNPQPKGIEQPVSIAEDVTVPEDAYIGAFAYIGKGVRLGNNVKIYPNSYIGHDCIIGDNTIIYPGVKVYHNVHIGADCVIHAGAVIGADGFGFAPLPDGSYRKIPQLGNVEIEDNVEIGANTTIDRATMGCTRIARGTKLDNLIQIAHNVKIGHDTVMASQVGVAGSAQIGDNCVLAGQVGIAGHIIVGDRVTIGAQSGIPNNVSSDQRVMGYPAVPGLTFARLTALTHRLPELFSKVDEIEKSLNNNK